MLVVWPAEWGGVEVGVMRRVELVCARGHDGLKGLWQEYPANWVENPKGFQMDSITDRPLLICAM